MSLPDGWTLRYLRDPEDRENLRNFYAETQDYILLETGEPPSEATIDELFANAPPGQDPSSCVRLGLFDPEGQIKGTAEQSFGYPNPTSSYIGLVMLAPSLRRQKFGSTIFGALLENAKQRGSTEMFIAVLDANPRGRAFWENMGFEYELSTDPITSGSATHVRHRLRRPFN